MEELQALWHKASDEEETPVGQAELESLINHKSSDELNKCKQVIQGEYVCSWLILPFLMLGLFWQPEYQLLALSLLVILAYLLYFYRRALDQFKQIHYEDSIQTYLQRALNFLKTYVQHYKVLCWVVGGLGGVIGYFGGYFTEEEEELHWTASPVGDLLLTMGMVIGVVLFVHFYIKYLYEARINNLEQLLQEFSEK